MKRMLSIGAAGLLAAAVFAVSGGLASAGPPGPAFLVDGEVYGTIGTPTDFSGTGAPDHSFDIIYDFGMNGPQMNVAEAAPGDRDYNGGRWQVHAVTFSDYDAAVDAADMNGSGDLDSAEEVQAAIAEGYATDNGVVKQFECPVIHLP